MPVLRGFTLNTPKRRSSIRSPRPSAFFIASKTVSTACSAFVRVIFVFCTIALTMSSLITRSSHGPETYARQGVAGCQAPSRVIHCPTLLQRQLNQVAQEWVQNHQRGFPEAITMAVKSDKWIRKMAQEHKMI